MGSGLLVMLTWAVAVRQNASSFCVRISFTKLGGSYNGLTVIDLVMSMLAVQCSWPCSAVSEGFEFKTRLMAWSGSSSSSGHLSLLWLEIYDSASMAW